VSIDIDTDFNKLNGVKMYAEGPGHRSEIIRIDSNAYGGERGFGVRTYDKNGKKIRTSDGEEEELGYQEKLIIEFDKYVDSIGASFGWRYVSEHAELVFKKDGKIVGTARVSGSDYPGYHPLIEYFDANGKKVGKEYGDVIKKWQQDPLHEFKFPKINGKEIKFNKVEFTAPRYIDDYCVNEITYNKDKTIEFDIQINKRYPPKGNKPTAKVLKTR